MKAMPVKMLQHRIASINLQASGERENIPSELLRGPSSRPAPAANAIGMRGKQGGWSPCSGQVGAQVQGSSSGLPVGMGPGGGP